MKGYRTLLIGFAMAVLPPALNYLLGIDWNSLVGAQAASMIAGGLMIVMRLVTNTPPGKDGGTPPAPPAQ